MTIQRLIMCHPSLVLLSVGFTMPLLLPKARCALTAPFHPYLLPGGLLSVALSLRLPSPDVIRHRVYVESGLSSMLAHSTPPAICIFYISLFWASSKPWRREKVSASALPSSLWGWKRRWKASVAEERLEVS